LVLVGADRIVSGGNFHAEPVGFAADQIALAVSEIGAIAQRRVGDELFTTWRVRPESR